MVENYRTQAGWQSWPRNIHFLVMSIVYIFLYLSVGCIKSVLGAGDVTSGSAQCPNRNNICPSDVSAVSTLSYRNRGLTPKHPNQCTGTCSRGFKHGLKRWKTKEKMRQLVAFVSQECRLFTPVLVTSLRSRMKPIWQYLQTMKLIDPLGPMDQYVTTAVWDVILKDLCCRHGLDFDTYMQGWHHYHQGRSRQTIPIND